MLEDQGISNEERERLIEGLIDMTKDILFLRIIPIQLLQNDMHIRVISVN